jgi:hypothetical protein
MDTLPCPAPGAARPGTAPAADPPPTAPAATGKLT